MASTKNVSPARRGNSRGRYFGYPIAPGEVIFAGSLVCVNAALQMVRPQTAGALAFVGLAQDGYNNAASTAPGPTIVAGCDEFYLNVPSTTAANINAPVYCTDDNTLTLTAPTSGFEAPIGALIGIENGQTVVEVRGYN